MSKKVNFDIEKIGLFRKAIKTDVIVNNTVYAICDDNELFKMNIDEILYPDDDFKAFVFDGCRYGLFNLYVLDDNSNKTPQPNQKLCAFFEDRVCDSGCMAYENKLYREDKMATVNNVYSICKRLNNDKILHIPLDKNL